jgi:putative tryptophan/tyrosine transport system substrate-binding protein
MQDMKASKFVLSAIVVALPLLSSTAYAQDNDGSYTIGLLSLVGNEAFIDEMTTLGYVEGENISYMVVNMAGFDDSDDVDAYNAEFNRQRQVMIDAGVDAFVTNTDRDAVHLMELDSETPIVFTVSIDPVAEGAVADLINPGGNVTGIIANGPHERRLQLLTDINPDTKKVYYVYIDNQGGVEDVLAEVQALAASMDIELVEAPLTDLPSALLAVNSIPEDADWVFLTNFLTLDYGMVELLELKASEQGAGLAWVTDESLPGFVMGYGPSVDASNRQAANIVDRILRGASPSELPVQTAENYLMINLEAAEELNLTVPEIVLRQASTIIRPGDLEAVSASAQ